MVAGQAGLAAGAPSPGAGAGSPEQALQRRAALASGREAAGCWLGPGWERPLGTGVSKSLDGGHRPSPSPSRAPHSPGPSGAAGKVAAPVEGGRAVCAPQGVRAVPAHPAARTGHRALWTDRPRRGDRGPGRGGGWAVGGSGGGLSVSRSGPPEPAGAERLGARGGGAGPKFRDPEKERSRAPQHLWAAAWRNQVPHLHPPWWAQAPSRAGQEVPGGRTPEDAGGTGRPGTTRSQVPGRLQTTGFIILPWLGGCGGG